MAENYYGYPLEDREKEDIGGLPKPDERKEEPLKQISGPPPKPRGKPTLMKKKF